MKLSTMLAALMLVLAASLTAPVSASLITDTAVDYSTVQGGNGYSYGHLIYAFGSAPDDTTFSTANMAYNAGSKAWLGSYDSGCCGPFYPQMFSPASNSNGVVLYHGVTNPSNDFGNDVYSGIPNNTTIASAIRWTSTYAGPATISGEFRFYNNCCNETQAPYVFVNGVAYIGNPNGPPTASATTITNTSFSTLVGPGPGAGEAGVGSDSGSGTNYGPLHSYKFNVTLALGDTVDWVVDPRLGFYGDLTQLVGRIVPEPSTLIGLAIGGLCLTLCAARRRRA